MDTPAQDLVLGSGLACLRSACLSLCVHVHVCSCCAQGELSVTLREARNLPVWGFPGQSNPYCRLVLGDQVRRAEARAGAGAGARRCAVTSSCFARRRTCWAPDALTLMLTCP